MKERTNGTTARVFQPVIYLSLLLFHMGIPMWDGKTSIKSVPIAFLLNSGMFQMRKETLLAFLASLSLIYFNCAFGHSKITV